MKLFHCKQKWFKIVILGISSEISTVFHWRPICISSRETIAEVCHIFHGLVYTFTPKPFEKNTDNLLLSLNHALWAAVNHICFKLFMCKTQNCLGKLRCLAGHIFFLYAISFYFLLSFFFSSASPILSKEYSSLKAIIVYCTCNSLHDEAQFV